MASDQLKIVLDPNGIDQIAAIIAHLKRRNDELTAALTAVQEVSTRQVDEIRWLRRQTAPSLCHCLDCIAERGRR